MYTSICLICLTVQNNIIITLNTHNIQNLLLRAEHDLSSWFHSLMCLCIKQKNHRYPPHQMLICVWQFLQSQGGAAVTVKTKQHDHDFNSETHRRRAVCEKSQKMALWSHQKHDSCTHLNCGLNIKEEYYIVEEEELHHVTKVTSDIWKSSAGR